ncbi:MAG: peptidoglycan-binding protein [Geitlerinemataceae cyanobacterium]
MSTLIDVEKNGANLNLTGIESPSASSPVATPEPQQIAAYPVSLPVLKIGHAGEAVRFLQQRLMAFGYSISFNGQFGFQTDGAVKHFQSYYGDLLVDGIVGPKTWRALCENFYPYGYYFYSDFIPSFYPYDTHMPTVGQGSQGNAVECLQLRLQASGYRILVDGIFGNNTRTTVEVYQNQNGLTVDGIVGRQTWRELGQ